jgi:hypothetical protein
MKTEKCREGENSLENRPRVGNRMIAEEMNMDKRTVRPNFNNKFEHVSLFAKMEPKESASF